MTRAVVNVSTGQYMKGQFRLVLALPKHSRHDGVYPFGAPTWDIPKEWPTHAEKPYAFKAYALKEAGEAFDVLLWADACILPVQSLEPLWERIERDGYWFSRNGWTNYEWTADSAYPDLFPAGWFNGIAPVNFDLEFAREENKRIPHLVATAFGLNVRHPKGRAFLDEYYRLASETHAFCGPWTNSPVTPCGPPDVRGHRHDQTAASVIAWRLGFELTDPPEIFAYGAARDAHDPRTILLADGSY